MTLGITVLLLAISGYFLLAAIFPKIRPSWGIGKGASIAVSRQGIERSNYKRTQPRMGAVTCLGFGTFIGGPAFGSIVSGVPLLYLIGAGFILMAIGAVLDSLRHPPRNTEL
jgi:hypothetical protein